MKAGRDYHADLIKHLKKPKEAVGYLNAALEEDDPVLFLLALRNVAEAQGNMSRFARECKISRANIYKMTSKAGNPSIGNVIKLIRCLGLAIKVEEKGKKSSLHLWHAQA